MEIHLAARAEKKKWFAIANKWVIALTLISAFTLVWGRVLKNAPLFILSLIVLIGLVSIQTVFSLLNAMKWIKMDKPNDLEFIVLSENTLLLVKREVLVSALKSLVIESDGYTGKWAGRHSKTGNGKLTFVHKVDKSEEYCLIVISSLFELNQLRALADTWRSRGLTALIMD